MTGHAVVTVTNPRGGSDYRIGSDDSSCSSSSGCSPASTTPLMNSSGGSRGRSVRFPRLFVRRTPGRSKYVLSPACCSTFDLRGVTQAAWALGAFAIGIVTGGFYQTCHLERTVRLR